MQGNRLAGPPTTDLRASGHGSRGGLTPLGPGDAASRVVLGIHQAVVDHVDIGRIDQFFKPGGGATDPVLIGRGKYFGRIAPVDCRLNPYGSAVHRHAPVAQLGQCRQVDARHASSAEHCHRQAVSAVMVRHAMRSSWARGSARGGADDSRKTIR
jgi:hypothetical protein